MHTANDVDLENRLSREGSREHLVIKEIMKMLNFLKTEANKTFTENGAVTMASTNSSCLDLFATAGALRNASDEEIIERFVMAFAEDRDIAMKILFFARDIRGGMGERRFFRVVLKDLALNYPEIVRKNITNIAEYGRCDDILVLMDTPCEADAIVYIRRTLESDISSMKNNSGVSLMAKWLPSANASSKETVRMAKKIARGIGMSEVNYRKTLSSLRAYMKILENNLRVKDYSFDYQAQPSKALFKYRKAFIRNDNERYCAFVNRASENPGVLNTKTLTPYEIIRPVIDGDTMSVADRKALDATWKSLENYAGSGNTLVVVDGSGSMYEDMPVSPIAVAESLGIYFAERNTGAFKNHFITFSSRPQLVEIKGRDIFDKVRYCMGFNEVSNTNIEKTFDLILNTAVKYRMKQKDMPERIVIISDMEFDWCTSDASLTNFENAKMKFESHGYKLPSVVFWNVNSRSRQQPVTMNEKGVTLVSGTSPSIFAMLKEGNLNPYNFMLSVIGGARYENIVA